MRKIIKPFSKSNLSKLFIIIVTAVAISVLTNSSAVFAQSFTQNDANSIIDQTPFYDPSDTCGTSSSSGSSSTSSGLSAGSSVYILGDSITSLTASSYSSAFQAQGAQVTVDGSYSRGVDNPGVPSEGPPTNTATGSMTGMEAIAADKDQITAANDVVVALGTNYGLTTQQVDETINAIKAINSSAKLYWIDTVVVDGAQPTDPNRLSWINSANSAIYSRASADGYTVIPWAHTFNSQANPPTPIPGDLTDPNDYMQSTDTPGAEDVHPNQAGQQALAGLVASTVLGSQQSNQSTACCGSEATGSVSSSPSDGPYTLGQVEAFLAEPITSTWSISDGTVEQWFLKQAGARSTIAKYGLNSSNIGAVTVAVEAAGVSPVFFYLYTVNEGGGAGGFINHYGSDVAGGAVPNATRDAQYLVSQSQKTGGKPATGGGEPKDMPTEEAQQILSALPAGSIGVAYIQATSAVTAELEDLSGKTGDWTGKFGTALSGAMQNIQNMGGDPTQGGTTSSSCSNGVTGEGIVKAISWAEMIANNNGYGYDQATRTSGWTNWQNNSSCTNQCGSFDCSSFIAAALTEAGYFTANPEFDTENEAQYLQQAGFTNVTSSIDLSTGQGLQPGDILLNTANHTAMYVGNNQAVEASHNENGGVSGGQVGDQTGKEIYVRPYWNFPWNSVWRAPSN